MTISEKIKLELCWLKSNINESVDYINQGKFLMTIYTDASRTGWDTTDGSREIFGFWDAYERN